MPQGTRYVIVGDGAAGLTAAQKLREIDPLSSICVLSDDPNPAYYRAALTNYLLGELTEAQIWAVTPSFFADYRVERMLARVAGVDTERQHVWLASGGAPLAYDQLLVAAGAHARPPPFEGAQLPGVATMRTLQDARGVMDLVLSRRVRRAVVIGGGPLAIEWAMALIERRVQVTMMVRETRVLGSALDPIGSDLVLARLRQAGVEVRTGDEVHAVFPGPDGRVAGVVTKAGQRIDCQLVGAAIGVVASTHFLRESKVKLSQRGSIVVDERMRTSAPRVFAAGDIVEIAGRLLQLWEPARRQALAAAINMAGGNAAYDPGAFYFATRLADLDFASVGDVSGAGAEELSDRSAKTGRIAYRKLLVREGRLLGALMLGHREERVRQRGRLFKRLIDDKVDVSSIKKSLLDPGFDLQAWLRGRDLVKKPPPPPSLRGAEQAEVKPSAFVRGTQFVNLGAAIAAMARAPVVEQAGGAPMLTIGLPKAATAFVAIAAPSAWLEVAGQRVPLSARVTSLGSDPRCEVPLQDAAVSHVHAQITFHNDEHYLQDLGSRSGTWVNGSAVTVPHRLRRGDEIRVGGSTLRFHKEGASRASSLPAQPPAPPPELHLEVRAGPRLGLRFALAAAAVTIGRDDANVVRIDDLSVSRRHAVLNQHGTGWYVCDLHSSRGTLKNGVRLAPGQDVALAEGDLLQLGDVVLAFCR